MGKMQATYNGVPLDNGSYRRIWDSFGDDIGFDGVRIVAVDFSIKGDTVTELETRKREVEDTFTVTNGRFTLTLDDTGSTLYADIAPNDGKHGNVSCKIGLNPARAQTAGCIELRLSCIAEVIPTAASGGVPGSSTPAFAGLVGELTYGHDYNAARVESYRVLATFATTFDDDIRGPYTIDSVETSGGKAVFVLSTTPVAFIEGMRLKVTAGTGYTGVHLITAINTTTKKVTTNTTFSATATGTAYIGEVTTGEDNYLAARATLLSDYLHVHTDGGRDQTVGADNTGMVLRSESRETQDEDGNMIQVFLESGFMEVALPRVSSARGLELHIGQQLPDKWPKAGGPRPVYLVVSGSVPCSRTVLGDVHTYTVWEDALREDIRDIVKENTGELHVRPLLESFDSAEINGLVTFQCRYQARNAKNIFYSLATEIAEEDDRIRALTARGFHYDQRPPGPLPATATVTATRIGIGADIPPIPIPGNAGAGCFWDLSKTIDSDQPFDGEFGDNMSAVSRTQIFIRTKYETGGANSGSGGITEAFDEALADAQGNSGFNGAPENTSISGI